MRNTILSVCLFICNYTFAYSQNQRNVWRMGYNGSPPTFIFDFRNSGGTNDSIHIDSITNSNAISMYIDNAGICDQAGNLLFYTNGIAISNSQHNIMLNGDSISPGPYSNMWRNLGSPVSQGAVVLPDPADTNEFYLFHSAVATNLNSDTLLVSKINMLLDGGQGGVVYKNHTVYIHSLMPGQLTATRHANGRDWWLICHHSLTDEFAIFLLSVNGISQPFIQHIGSVMQYPMQACFSPNGEKFACSYDNGLQINVFNFDRCSGVFSNFQDYLMPDSNNAISCCFSPNSQRLYVSGRYNLYQFDLNNSNLTSGCDTVATWDGHTDPAPNAFGFCQLAIDGKIYITGWGAVLNLNVVNYPDSIGSACNVQQHSLSLPGRNNGTMPNYPFYELGALTGSVCDSLSMGVSDVSYSNQFSIYPNPVNSLVYIQHENTEAIRSIKFFNSFGRQFLFYNIANSSSGLIEINIVSLESGIYFIQIETNTLQKVFVIFKE